MIYTDSQLKEKIVRMIESFENEVVEFKEARTNYSFNDIGKYFSALSNEANLRGLQEAWLIFGISDEKGNCRGSRRFGADGGVCRCNERKFRDRLREKREGW